MSETFTRREALLAAGAMAASAWAAEKPALDGTMIDTHVHLVQSGLAGAEVKSLPLAPFDRDADTRRNKLAALVVETAKAAGVGQLLCMPSSAVTDADPLGIHETLAVAAVVKGVKVHAVGVAHPERYDRGHLSRVEGALKEGRVKALKAYLGYLPYGPSAPGYRPYYKLAAKYRVPVIFHTGDTLSRSAKVKYAHPLRVDEVAVDHPDTRFVLAHFGNPWIMDAAQVVYKNRNVWADLSAILVGDAAVWAAMEKDGVIGRAVKRIQEGIEYTEAPERFLFASDWPLSPIAAYRDFVRRMFPEALHAGVFRDNAAALFGL
ncbi:MAG: amidohydrolase family protein [Gemmataceae bacterium]